MNQDTQYLTAEEAARLLGVKVSSLYAYASRGRIRRIQADDGRRSLYDRKDLERLLEDRGRDRAGAAAGALDWGEPVLSSAITSIGVGGIRYRGYSALELAGSDRTFEAIAELLWGGELPDGQTVWSSTVPAAILLTREARPLEAFATAFPLLALHDPERHGAPPGADRERARAILRRLAALLSDPCSDPRGADPRPLAETIARGLGREDRWAHRAIDRALVLCADHELNASTFAARVTASTGADLYACLASAVATLSGPRHGGVSDRVEALVDEVGQPARARRVLSDRLARGDDVPGFGHRLYPDGDPRARPLLEAARAIEPASARWRVLEAIVEAMAEAGHAPPALDVGLVAVASAIELPPGGAVGLFALGRAAGWVAHILEQRESPDLLRPRARYVGPPAR